MDTIWEKIILIIDNDNLERLIPIVTGILGGIAALIEVILRVKELRQTQKMGLTHGVTRSESKKSKGLRILSFIRQRKAKALQQEEEKALMKVGEIQSPDQSKQIFISYKVGAYPDHELMEFLEKALSKRGHKPFIHTMLPIGIEWGQSLQSQIEKSDFLLVLLSESSVRSEMVVEEVRFAEFCRKQNNKPTILPVRVNYLKPLPYGLASYLDAKQFALWREPEDTDELAQKIFLSIEAASGEKPFPKQENTITQKDSAEEPDKDEAPLPSFDPRFLETPTGAVKLRSPYYIRRDCDDKIERQILGGGGTTTIRSGRQMGKTSLLVRGANFAKEQGHRVVYLDFQQMESEFRSSLDNLLRYLADELTFRLGLDEEQLNKIWTSSRGGPDKFNHFMESSVLQDPAPLLIAVDEADQLMDADYKTDFFALLRAWDSRRAFDTTWEKLSLALVISTHPHLLIDDYRQSPFNVGLRIPLEDFSEEQIISLNKRHNIPLTEKEIPQIVDLLGGHPYLSRQALYTMVDSRISWTEFQSIVLDDPGPFSSHLHFYLWQLRDRPELIAGLKETIKKNSCSDEKVLYRLSAAGLLKELPENKCAVRCRLYEQYFRKALNV